MARQTKMNMPQPNSSILTLLLSLLLIFSCNALLADEPDPAQWNEVLQDARGQNIYFYAWGGESRINRFIDWAKSELQSQFGIDLQHVKLSDTAQAVSRVLAEKQAGNLDNGAVDLLWVNGENFAALKSNQLLYGPWAEDLPNFELVDAERNPEMREDFTVSVEGLESPWTRAQLVFYYDTQWLQSPPRSIRDLLEWSKSNPGEFTYPRPPDFLGSTFLKQALLELVTNKETLYEPMRAAEFEQVTAPLWSYLDALHPHLLRSGRYFPTNGAALRTFLSDGETSLAFSFSPNEALTGIASGELPDSVRSYVLSGGTIANVSFLAIPFNARNKAAAMVTANFLLSPAAQARAYDPAHLGNLTVLSMDQLTPAQRRLFESIKAGPAAPSLDDLSRTLQEPHSSWMPALESAWLQRYLIH